MNYILFSKITHKMLITNAKMRLHDSLLLLFSVCAVLCDPITIKIDNPALTTVTAKNITVDESINAVYWYSHNIQIHFQLPIRYSTNLIICLLVDVAQRISFCMRKILF